MTATIRVGVCSWADETLTKVWYPRGVRSGEARLRHYAERFGTVEANSTYYRLPEAEIVGNWAERTPDGFTMHVKAFGLMTRHPVKLEVLPEFTSSADFTQLATAFKRVKNITKDGHRRGARER